MDVILLQRVQGLGLMGQCVSVKPGYARNYLLPKGKALRATKDNRAYFEDQKAQFEAQNIKRRDEAQYAATKMEGVFVTLIRQASDVGHLYGSVRSKDIADALSEKQITVSRTQIEIPKPIKNLGIHDARIVLHPEVHVVVKVNVAQSEEEAAVQGEALEQA